MVTTVSVAPSVRCVDEASARVKALLKERGWSARELGRQAGMVEEHAIKLLGRGLSTATATNAQKIADALGVRLKWLLTGEGPRDLPASEVRVEYDERYPNRRRALAGLDVAGIELHPRARRAIETRVYHSTTDPPPEHWTREALQLDERARWEDEHPAEAALERDRDRARLEQLLAEESAKSQAAVDKIPGVRGPKDLDPPPPKGGKKPGGK